MINEKNWHERDNFIDFDEESHTYYLNDNKYISVTTFIHNFFNKFDADKIINQYYDKWQKNKHKDYYGKTPDEIKQMWEQNRDNASEFGTMVHLCIENHLLGKTITQYTKEYEQFLEFEKETEYLEPYRAEWQIYDEDLMIAGTIDAVYKDTRTGEYVIVDWKTNADIKTKNYYEYGKYPLQDLQDCNFTHYSLQLNMYRRILERKYGIKIGKMMLCWLNNKNPSYKALEINHDDKSIDLMINERLNKI